MFLLNDSNQILRENIAGIQGYLLLSFIMLEKVIVVKRNLCLDLFKRIISDFSSEFDDHRHIVMREFTNDVRLDFYFLFIEPRIDLSHPIVQVV
jgi:hypothetical protein